jgi:hypothetical protein
MGGDCLQSYNNDIGNHPKLVGLCEFENVFLFRNILKQYFFLKKLFFDFKHQTIKPNRLLKII